MRKLDSQVIFCALWNNERVFKNGLKTAGVGSVRETNILALNIITKYVILDTTLPMFDKSLHHFGSLFRIYFNVFIKVVPVDVGPS